MKNITSFLLLLCCAGRWLSASCTATTHSADYGADNGSASTATVTVNVHSPGDLVVFSAYCYPSCPPVSLTMGSQAATQTTISGKGIMGNPGTGQGFIYYITSAVAFGPQTATFTASGSYSDIQTAYIDFGASTGCTFQHHLDYPLGSSSSTCQNNNNCPPINAPIFTPTAGDVL